MSYLYVGASSTAHMFPCHRSEDWDALLAAMASDNTEEILRITLGSVPRMVASAHIHDIAPPPPKSLGELAEHFWATRRRTGSANSAKLVERVAIPDLPREIREVRA